MKESKVEKKELAYMKKGGAPKSMLEHEKREHQEMKKGNGKPKGAKKK